MRVRKRRRKVYSYSGLFVFRGRAHIGAHTPRPAPLHAPSESGRADAARRCRGRAHIGAAVLPGRAHISEVPNRREFIRIFPNLGSRASPAHGLRITILTE